LIHPSQFAAANHAFSPSDAEIVWAQAVVSAFEGSDEGVLPVNGEMVERLHLEQARAILSIAELT
jgi:citrate lyase beta subunit